MKRRKGIIAEQTLTTILGIISVLLLAYVAMAPTLSLLPVTTSFLKGGSYVAMVGVTNVLYKAFSYLSNVAIGKYGITDVYASYVFASLFGDVGDLDSHIDELKLSLAPSKEVISRLLSTQVLEADEYFRVYQEIMNIYRVLNLSKASGIIDIIKAAGKAAKAGKSDVYVDLSRILEKYPPDTRERIAKVFAYLGVYSADFSYYNAKKATLVYFTDYIKGTDFYNTIKENIRNSLKSYIVGSKKRVGYFKNIIKNGKFEGIVELFEKISRNDVPPFAKKAHMFPIVYSYIQLIVKNSEGDEKKVALEILDVLRKYRDDFIKNPEVYSEIIAKELRKLEGRYGKELLNKVVFENIGLIDKAYKLVEILENNFDIFVDTITEYLVSVPLLNTLVRDKEELILQILKNAKELQEGKTTRISLKIRTSSREAFEQLFSENFEEITEKNIRNVISELDQVSLVAFLSRIMEKDPSIKSVLKESDLGFDIFASYITNNLYTFSRKADLEKVYKTIKNNPDIYLKFIRSDYFLKVKKNLADSFVACSTYWSKLYEFFSKYLIRKEDSIKLVVLFLEDGINGKTLTNVLFPLKGLDGVTFMLYIVKGVKTEDYNYIRKAGNIISGKTYVSYDEIDDLIDEFYEEVIKEDEIAKTLGDFWNMAENYPESTMNPVPTDDILSEASDTTEKFEDEVKDLVEKLGEDAKEMIEKNSDELAKPNQVVRNLPKNGEEVSKSIEKQLGKKFIFMYSYFMFSLDVTHHGLLAGLVELTLFEAAPQALVNIFKKILRKKIEFGEEVEALASFMKMFVKPSEAKEIFRGAKNIREALSALRQLPKSFWLGFVVDIAEKVIVTSTALQVSGLIRKTLDVLKPPLMDYKVSISKEVDSEDVLGNLLAIYIREAYKRVISAYTDFLFNVPNPYPLLRISFKVNKTLNFGIVMDRIREGIYFPGLSIFRNFTKRLDLQIPSRTYLVSMDDLMSFEYSSIPLFQIFPIQSPLANQRISLVAFRCKLSEGYWVNNDECRNFLLEENKEYEVFVEIFDFQMFSPWEIFGYLYTVNLYRISSLPLVYYMIEKKLGNLLTKGLGKGEVEELLETLRGEGVLSLMSITTVAIDVAIYSFAMSQIIAMNPVNYRFVIEECGLSLPELVNLFESTLYSSIPKPLLALTKEQLSYALSGFIEETKPNLIIVCIKEK